MHVKKQQLEPNMEQWTGSKLGEEYYKAVCCHPAYLTSMQSTSCEMFPWYLQFFLKGSLVFAVLLFFLYFISCKGFLPTVIDIMVI